MLASGPVLLLFLALPARDGAETLTGTFADTQVVSGVDKATIARFAPDGEVFVAAQGGKVERFANVASTEKTLVANLGVGGSEEVANEDDRGLLGMAVDPAYPTKPYVYLLFTYNAPPGLTAPFWKPEGELACPTPPGPEVDGCTVTGRLVRITIDQSTHRMVPGSQIALIKNEWCQQFTSHSVGDLQFGPEGALYVSAGAGGDWNRADYGQLGGTQPNAAEPVTPVNPCGDPVESTVGEGYPGLGQNKPSKEKPTEAEGGMLRSQSFRRPAAQPATLDGTIARVNPENGEPLSSNPNFASSDPNRRRIVAYGFRQPFRFVFRPEHETEMWVADVGENTWEEINRVEHPLKGASADYGWPCYEGKEPEPDEYKGPYVESDLCTGLAKAGTAMQPVYAYSHRESVVTGDGCPVDPIAVGSAISAIGFQHGGPYPPEYAEALFFGDYARSCMWAMLRNPETGLPDPKHIVPVFNANSESSKNPDAGFPVDIEVGPDRNLYYVNRNFGELRRLSDSEYPTAIAKAHAAATFDTPVGVAPLTATFNAQSSTSPHPDAKYEWNFGDETTSNEVNPPPHTYPRPGTYTATLKVTDTDGHTDMTSISVIADRPLQALASADKSEGVGPLTVNFTGHESSAPDSIATYHWDFGDGTSADTPDATHTYTAPGIYTATLQITDVANVPGAGTTSSASVHVTVNTSPPAQPTGLAQVIAAALTGAVSPPAPPAKTKLTLGAVRLDNRRFAAAPTQSLRKPVRHHGYTTGTTLHFVLTQAALVKLSFAKRVGTGKSARWVSIAAKGVLSRCRRISSAPNGAQRHARKVCRRPSSDHLALTGTVGANALVLSGWVGGVAFSPGSYELTLAAHTASARAPAARLSFVVVAPRIPGHASAGARRSRSAP